MKLNNKIYDVLKWTAMLLLPALATLIRAVCAIWGLPYGEEIAGTVIAVDAFIGAVIGVSNAGYNRE